MINQDEVLNQYLNEVSEYLDILPDKEQILRELRNHIWDLANKLSVEKSLPIHIAFKDAIMMMEDPKTLAKKFLEEDDKIINIKTNWKVPQKFPESKIKNEHFLIIAILGFGMVLGISWILQLISKDPLVTFLAFFIGLFAASIMVLGLYLSDERLFNEQIKRLREMFYKPQERKKIKKQLIKKTASFKEDSFWGPFGEHLGGVIGGCFIAILMAFFLLMEVISIPLYNPNWYPIGAIAIYISLISSFLYQTFKVVFGRVRVTRLISATSNIIGVITAVILLLYYPFTVGLAINTIFPDVLSTPELTLLVSNADRGVQLIIGLAGIINAIEALYDIFKFGAWKPTDRKSLI